MEVKVLYLEIRLSEDDVGLLKVRRFWFSLFLHLLFLDLSESLITAALYLSVLLCC